LSIIDLKIFFQDDGFVNFIPLGLFIKDNLIIKRGACGPSSSSILCKYSDKWFSCQIFGVFFEHYVFFVTFAKKIEQDYGKEQR